MKNLFTQSFKFCICLCLMTSQIFSQVTVSGTVVDNNGELLLGANVLELGTSNGTITDIDGTYSFQVAANATLEFSFTGFTTIQIAVNGQNTVNATLSAGALLDEIVVTGYGTLRSREVTSSITSVKAEDFNQGNITSPEQLLQGKVAGLSIAKPGSNPNDAFNIRLRGISTLGANEQPLIVIDGAVGASLDNLDPNDIASIDVLKDGGAAAIYGTRASSGVLIITTKSGRKDQKMAINYNVYGSSESRARKVDVADASLFASLGGVDLGTNTNWNDEISRSAAYSHVHNLSASGGSKNTTYRGSVSYRDIEGIQKKTGFNRVSGRFSLNQTAANDRMNLNLTFATSSQESVNGFGEAYRYATVYNPSAPIFDSDGGYDEIGGFDYFNPVALIEQNSNEQISNTSFGSAKLSYELIDGLILGGYYSEQTISKIGEEYYSRDAQFRGANRRGLARSQSDRFFNRQFDITVDYEKDFGGIKMTLLGGTSYQRFSDQGTFIEAGGFVTDDVSLFNLSLSADIQDGIANVSSYKRRSQLFAFFGRLNLNKDNTYFFSATIRPEQHDRFGENDRWGTFGAVSAGIILTNLADFGPFDFLKVRASYGITGSIPDTRLIAPALETLIRSGNAFSNGEFVQAFAPGSNANPDLKWETKKELDIGVDFGIGKFSGTIDYYTRTTSDLLRFAEVPVPPNLFSTTLTNVGEMANSGIELAIRYEADLGNDFSWTPELNFATYSTELKAIDREETFTIGALGSPGLNSAQPIRVVVGEPVGQIYVPEFNGITEDGNWNVSSNQEEFVLAGNGLPDFTFNFGNTFRIKKIDINFLLRGTFGHSLVNTLRAFYEQPNVPPTYNVLTSSTNPRYDGLTTNESRLSTLHVEKGDFLKLDNLTLGYSMDVSNSDAIKSLRLYVTGQNLFVVTGYEGVDPEVRYADFGSSDNGGRPNNEGNADPLAPGIDRRNTWFTTRTFTVGLNIGF